jgi:hypothetical protein
VPKSVKTVTLLAYPISIIANSGVVVIYSKSKWDVTNIDIFAVKVVVSGNKSC